MISFLLKSNLETLDQCHILLMYGLVKQKGFLYNGWHQRAYDHTIIALNQVTGIIQ